MVDLKFMGKIDLASYPHFQAFVARTILTPNYKLFAKVDIEIENVENIPRNETVIIAMNHTDRYNYWPFQYKLWKLGGFPYTTVWVKGKYFKNFLLRKFFEWANTFPVPTKAYLIEEFFRNTFKRKINPEEYRVLKDVFDRKIAIQEAMGRATDEIKALLSDKWQKLSHTKEGFVLYIDNYYQAMMERVAEISRSALNQKNLNIIIFPEGTRSAKLAEGKTGIAQLALNTGKKILPVGCNNSESVYSGNLPFARSGKVVYRVGEPLSLDNQLREHRITERFKLFSKESQEKYRAQFEGVTKIVMEKINGLLDEKYKI